MLQRPNAGVTLCTTERRSVRPFQINVWVNPFAPPTEVNDGGRMRVFKDTSEKVAQPMFFKDEHLEKSMLFKL